MTKALVLIGVLLKNTPTFGMTSANVATGLLAFAYTKNKDKKFLVSFVLKIMMNKRPGVCR